MFNIFDELKNCKSVAISAHERPDGDAVGSCLGLCLYLKKRMPNAKICVFLDKPANCFADLPGFEYIDYMRDSDDVYDAFVMLDTSDERLGDSFKYYEKASLIINIDHHISNENGCGAFNYIVPSASSTCELVYDVMDKEFIDRDIASLIYLGIAHDTGVFRFSNTSPKTMDIISRLLSYNFDFSSMLDKTFYEKSFAANKALGQVLISSTLYFEGKLIIGTITREIMDDCGANKDDLDGIVNQLMATAGVEVGVFIYPKKENTIKVSLRASSDLVNVSSVAARLGGGGHVRASGFDYVGSYEDAIQELIKYIGEQIVN